MNNMTFAQRNATHVGATPAPAQGPTAMSMLCLDQRSYASSPHIRRGRVLPRMPKLCRWSCFAGAALCLGLAAPPIAGASVDRSEAEDFAQEHGISKHEATVRLDWQERASALTDRTRAAVGRKFAGVWIDKSTGRVKVGLVGADKDALMSVRARLKAVGLQTGGEIVTVRRSEAALNAAVDWLSTRFSEIHNESAPNPLTAGVRSDRNAVELSLPANNNLTRQQASLVREAQAKYGDALTFGRYAQPPKPDACSTGASAPPLYCDPPLRAGIYIFADFACTGAFLGRSRTDGVLYQFTAGHCREAALNWSTNFATNGSTHVIGPFHNAVNDSRGDAGILRVNNPSGWNARAWVFVTRSSDTTRDEAYRITSDSTSAVNQRVCITGASRGSSDCGTVQAVNVSANGVNGLIQATYCRQPGDSGGPIYASHSAKGLHHGGSGCTGYYQDIRRAENLMNVNVSFDAG